jgi:hypothetical protein
MKNKKNTFILMVSYRSITCYKVCPNKIEKVLFSNGRSTLNNSFTYDGDCGRVVFNPDHDVFLGKWSSGLTNPTIFAGCTCNQSEILRDTILSAGSLIEERKYGDDLIVVLSGEGIRNEEKDNEDLINFIKNSSTFVEETVHGAFGGHIFLFSLNRLLFEATSSIAGLTRKNVCIVYQDSIALSKYSNGKLQIQGGSFFLRYKPKETNDWAIRSLSTSIQKKLRNYAFFCLANEKEMANTIKIRDREVPIKGSYFEQEANNKIKVYARELNQFMKAIDYNKLNDNHIIISLGNAYKAAYSQILKSLKKSFANAETISNDENACLSFLLSYAYLLVRASTEPKHMIAIQRARARNKEFEIASICGINELEGFQMAEIMGPDYFTNHEVCDFKKLILGTEK